MSGFDDNDDVEDSGIPLSMMHFFHMHDHGPIPLPGTEWSAGYVYSSNLS